MMTNSASQWKIDIVYDKDLIHLPVHDTNEPMVNVRKVCPTIIIDLDPDSRRFFKKNSALLRVSIAKRLARIQARLEQQGMSLLIRDAYRPLELQRKIYTDFMHKVQKDHPQWTPAEIEKHTSTFVAPVLEGVIPPHSTGGTVDITIVKKGLISKMGKKERTSLMIDMGSSLRDLSEKSFTDSPLVSETGRKNRHFLRKMMEEEGFFNYPGEWWHFSIGDRNWAHALQKDSYYDSVPLGSIKHLL